MAAYVRKKGGVPHPVAELGQAPGLVAAPTWQLSSLALGPSGITLHETHHIIAATPGENAWLMRIEQSIATAEADRRHDPAHVAPVSVGQPFQFPTELEADRRRIKRSPG